MKAKVIGLGAAGGKAAITLIENNIMSKDDVLIINSTLRDVPDSYKDIAIKFSNTVGGCGKQRDMAKELCLGSIKDDSLSVLNGFMDPDDDAVFIVNAAEGGTGSGSSAIIAKYMKEVIGINVHMFVFTGFEEDGRGLQNTIEYFQDLSEDYMVEAISNKKFLEGGNKLKAEVAANHEFAKRVKVLTGREIVQSDQNIDETDLYKITNTPGFRTTEYREVDKIKNVSMFNDIITSMIDDSKSLESSDLSAKRIGVILNVSEKSRDFIDYGFSVIKERYGTPYEIYTHVQDNQDKEFIAFIVSGMVMPLEEVKTVYQKYIDASNAVNKKRDEFLDVAKSLKGNQEDAMFNMKRHSVSNTIDANKKDFLKSFGLEDATINGKTSKEETVKATVVRSDSGFQNTKKNKDDFLKENNY